jgi:hypothetical protein
MKKVIPVLLIGALLAGLWIQYGQPVQTVAKTVFSSPALPPGLGNSVSPLARAEKSDVVAQAMVKAKSLENFESDYSGLKPTDLEKELSESETILKSRSLIAKSNRGDLTSEEAFVLLTEIRRQYVLNTLLTKEKIDQLKRRFL